LVKVQRVRNVAWRKIGDETVVVNLGRKMMYGLNELGGRVWEALNEPVDVEILERFVLTEAGHEELARSSLRSFLAELAQEELLLGGSPAPADPTASEGYANAPAITWREEIRKFAGNCGLLPAGGGACTSVPQFS